MKKYKITCKVGLFKWNLLERLCFVGEPVICISIETPKIINFPFAPNGKLIISGVPKIFGILQYLLFVVFIFFKISIARLVKKNVDKCLSNHVTEHLP